MNVLPNRIPLRIINVNGNHELLLNRFFSLLKLSLSDIRYVIIECFGFAKVTREERRVSKMRCFLVKRCRLKNEVFPANKLPIIKNKVSLL